MSKAVKIVVAIVVVAAIAVAVVVVANSGSDKANDNSTSQKSQTPGSGSDKAVVAVTSPITYNGSSFSPETTTIKSGGSIKVTNKSHNQLDFGSDPHPTHTDEPELNAGAINPGESKTFTVTKKGTWGFHNHFDPSQHGTIKVQ